MSNLVWIDKDQGISGHSDEDIREYERRTTYHPSNSVKSQVRESNCSPAQYNVNNQRRR